VFCWRLPALHLLVLNAINSYSLLAAEAQHNARILSTVPHLPGHLPGVATPGADIQWTFS